MIMGIIESIFQAFCEFLEDVFGNKGKQLAGVFRALWGVIFSPPPPVPGPTGQPPADDPAITLLIKQMQDLRAAQGDRAYEIAFLGTSGTGKTTILSALTNYFHSESLKQLRIYLSKSLSKRMEVIAKELNTIGTSLSRDSSQKVGPAEGIKATRDVIEFTAAIGTPGSTLESAGLLLKFTDYPGEYLGKDTASESDRVFMKSVADSADCLIIPVDAPYIMDAPDFYAERSNQKEIERLLTTVIEFGVKPKLVLFIATRCEKYLGSDEGATLTGRIIQQYSLSLTHLERFASTARVAVLPLESVGFLEFSSFGQTAGLAYPAPCFFKIRSGWSGELVPRSKYADQVFYHVMALVLFSFLQEIPEQFAALREAFYANLGNFESRFRRDETFQILQDGRPSD